MNRSTVSLFDAIETIASTCRKPAALLVMTLSVALGAESGLFDAFKGTDPELEAVRTKNAATPVVPVLQTRSIAPGAAPTSELAVPPPTPTPAPTVPEAVSAEPVPAAPAAAPASTAATSAAAPASTAVASAAPTAGLPRTQAKETAVPKVGFGSVSLEKPATPEQIDEARRAFIDKKYSLANVSLTVDEVDDETVTCLLVAFPEVRSLEIWNTPLKSLDAVGSCKGLVDLQIKGGQLPDLAPLAGNGKLKVLRLPQTTIRSLAPLGGLANLEKIVLDDATFDDFTPLAKCPKLEEVDFSGATVPDEKQGTLGQLKQVVRFYGTFKGMTSVAWAKGIPQATTLHVGRGKIGDFSPLSALVNVEELHLWGLKQRGDAQPIGSLSFLKPCVKVSRLNLAQSDYVDFAVVGGMKDLQDLNLAGSVNPIDLSVLKDLPKLRKLDLSDCEVTHFEALVGHPALAELNISGAKGVGSVRALVANKALRDLTVSEGAFPAADLEEVKKELTAANANFSLNAY